MVPRALHDPVEKRDVPVVDSHREHSAISASPSFNDRQRNAMAQAKQSRRVKRAGRALAKDDETHYSIGFWPQEGKLLFQESTAIRQVIVFPDQVGGGSDFYVYITSSNRSELGVESHIAYYAQEAPEFWIFDWSISDPNAQLALRFTQEQLARFLFPVTLQGLERHGLLLINETRRAQGTDWINTVFLAVMQAGRIDHFETVYTRSYHLDSNEQQQPNRNGYWGPEVETMRRFTERINPMGCTQNWFIQDGVSHPLDASNTRLEDNANGLTLLYESPSRDFLVH
jgi:hypothetical protein